MKNVKLSYVCDQLFLIISVWMIAERQSSGRECVSIESSVAYFLSVIHTCVHSEQTVTFRIKLVLIGGVQQELFCQQRTFMTVISMYLISKFRRFINLFCNRREQCQLSAVFFWMGSGRLAKTRVCCEHFGEIVLNLRGDSDLALMKQVALGFAEMLDVNFVYKTLVSTNICDCLQVDEQDASRYNDTEYEFCSEFSWGERTWFCSKCCAFNDVLVWKESRWRSWWERPSEKLLLCRPSSTCSAEVNIVVYLGCVL